MQNVTCFLPPELFCLTSAPTSLTLSFHLCTLLTSVPAACHCSCWPPHFSSFRFLDTIRCPWYMRALTWQMHPLPFSWSPRVQWKSLNSKLDLGWILIFPLTQHVSLQFSYHLGFFSSCKEKDINAYLEGYLSEGNYEKMCFRCIIQFLPDWVHLISVSQCVVPRTPASESLKMQILRVTVALI